VAVLSVSVLRAVDDTAVSPGVLGFVVVALLGVATYLLIRSMNRQIRRIDLPQSEPQDPVEDGGEQPPSGEGDRQGGEDPTR
jgi:hypothetical protein